MRTAILARLVFALSAVAGIGVWVACGGSDDQDVTSLDAGRDTSPAEEEDQYTPPKPSPSDAQADSPSNPERDAGNPIVIFPEAGPFADGGLECFEGGELEDEPNDDRATANEFPPGTIETKQIRRVVCGYIEGTDGGPDAGESDWLRFELADAATGFRVQYYGNLAVHVDTDGMAPVDITQPGASLGTPKLGQPYFVHVRSKDGDTQTWKIVVFEDIPQ